MPWDLPSNILHGISFIISENYVILRLITHKSCHSAYVADMYLNPLCIKLNLFGMTSFYRAKTMSGIIPLLNQISNLNAAVFFTRVYFQQNHCFSVSLRLCCILLSRFNLNYRWTSLLFCQLPFNFLPEEINYVLHCHR